MIADSLYEAYAQKPGSQHIASLNACRGLEHLVYRYNPQRVLEIGSGIGTLTDLLTQTLDPKALLVTVESDPFCLEQMSLNLGSRLSRVVRVPDLDSVEEQDFDLVIVDGGRSDVSVTPFVARRGLVFVEGFRGDQRDSIEKSGRPYAATNVRAMHRGGSPSGVSEWGGAYWVYRLEPTSVERIRFVLHHFWNGPMVSKRRRLQEMFAPGRPARNDTNQ
jgi:hypothetical protein